LSDENTRYYFLAILAVVVLAITAHANGLSGEFVLDDRPFIIDNQKIDESHSLVYFFSENVWSYSNDADNYPRLRYRPLYFASLWLVNNNWPGSSLAMHVFSLSLHVIASVLLLVAIPRLFPSISLLAATIGACLFAVHPVHAEAVSWISALVHPMVTVFLLASYLLHDCQQRTSRLLAHIGAIFFFTLALLSNEMAVCFPFFILLHDALRYSRVRLVGVAPYFLLLATYLIIRQLVLGSTVPLNILDVSSWIDLFGFLVEYMRYLVLPWPQPLYLAMPRDWSLSLVSGLVAGFLIGFIIYLLARSTAGRRGVLLATAWIATALTPPLLAAFTPDAKFALRSLYLPSVGLAMLLAWAVHTTPWFRRKSGLTWIAGVLLLAIGTTYAANRDWLDDGRVYRKITSQYPDNLEFNLYIGEYMEHIGKTTEALHLYRKSVAIAKPEEKLRSLEALGTLLGKSGDSRRSLEVFRQMTTLDSDSVSAWIGVGNNLWQMGRLDEAAEAYRNAYRIAPENWKTCANLIQVLSQTGRTGEATRYVACAGRQQDSTTVKPVLDDAEQ
jgi:Tfp pilus assembly protein PilF